MQKASAQCGRVGQSGKDSTNHWLVDYLFHHYHIQNISDFVNKVKDLEVPPGQKLVSYDVSALFSSIPVPDAITAIERKFNSDHLLHTRTPLSHKRIIELLSFCLNATYFSYKDNIYEQKHGAAMGSPMLYKLRSVQNTGTCYPGQGWFVRNLGWGR